MDTQTKESQNSKNVFNTIISLLGQKAEISDKYTGKHIVLNVTTEEPGRLIGRKGIALNSITHLMNLMLKRESPEHPHVIIDVHGIGEDKRERPPRKEKRERAPRKDNRKDNRNESNEGANSAPAAKQEASKKDEAPAKQEKSEAKAESTKKKAPEAKTETPAAKQDAPKKDEAPAAKQEEKPKAKPEQKLSRLQLECRNAAKEVKKWGDATYLPAMAEAECFKAIDNFKNDKEIVATIDESRSNGDKKRVKLALKA